MCIKNCFECGKLIENPEDIYITNCFEGFGDGVYCENCVVEGALEGFDDPKLVCTCNERMNIFEHCLYLDSTDGYYEERDYEWLKNVIIDKFARGGMLFYMCINPKCSSKYGVGVYTRQRDEFTNTVWEQDLDLFEVEHEYVDDDYVYTIYYDAFNPHLYQKPYTPDWKEKLEKEGIRIIFERN